jgi:hypothetical protein
MKKFLDIITILLLSSFGCESIINDIENNRGTIKETGDFKEAQQRVFYLEKKFASTLNHFNFIVAIATDEAAESSSLLTHDLLGKQNFDNYNVDISNAYQNFVDIIRESEKTRKILSTLKFSVNFQSKDYNATELKAFYISKTYFLEALSYYKLATNWDKAEINSLLSPKESLTKSLELLNMAFSNSEDLSYNKIDRKYTNEEIKSFLATINYYRAYSEVNLATVDTTNAIAHLDSAVNYYNKQEKINLDGNPYDFLPESNLIAEFSELSSVKMVFDSVYFEDDERIAIERVFPKNLKIQGSIAQDDSIHRFIADKHKYFVQNKYQSSTSLNIYSFRKHSNMLAAEILYHLMLKNQKNIVEENGKYIFPSTILKFINQSRNNYHKRKSSIPLQQHQFSDPEKEKRIKEVKVYLLQEYLAINFLEGRRLEHLRRFGIKPYFKNASKEYKFFK